MAMGPRIGSKDQNLPEDQLTQQMNGPRRAVKPSIELAGRASTPPRAPAPPSASFGPEGRPPSQPTKPGEAATTESGMLPRAKRPGEEEQAQDQGMRPGEADQPSGEESLAEQPPLQTMLPRSPKPADVDAMAAGSTLETPFGTVNKTLDGRGRMELSEQGKMRIAQNRVALKQRFGKTPVDGIPGMPEFPLEVGKSNYNPFEGNWID